MNIDQLVNSFNSHLEKHFNLVLPSQPNSLNPLKIERGNPLPKRLLVSCKKNLVLPIDRETRQRGTYPHHHDFEMTIFLHFVQSFVSIGLPRSIVIFQDAFLFNLAMDDENIDFNISGIPDATVKRSQSISVHDLIQKIESHPQKETIQNDLEQHRPFNPFSDESKVAIMAAGNTELCEIINVEPKLQCKACLKHWSAGIVYCTCGHLMKDDSAENKKYISAVLDTFSIPNFYIRKYRPHGHRYGKAPGCKDYYTANQLARKCRKKKYDSIHDRYIRDKTFRKAMIEVGRSEKIILEMDQLASENHTYKATKAEIDVYRGNWWILSNVANFDSVPARHQLDFKKALSTMHRLKQAEDEKQYAIWSQSSFSSSWQWQTNWWESDHEYSPQRWYDH